LIRETLEFSTKTAGDVMVPMDQLVTVAPDVTPAEVEALVAQTGFSRFPVRLAGSDQLAGYLHVMDVASLGEGRDQPIDAAKVRALPSLNGSDEIEEALALMQVARCHMVEVAGGGVVFMDDVLEELVGEIRDAQQRNQTRRS
jgi:CBS domain containing-hemolysin-like protein